MGSGGVAAWPSPQRRAWDGDPPEACGNRSHGWSFHTRAAKCLHAAGPQASVSELPERLAARLEVAKLVEARARRAEQHDLAGATAAARAAASARSRVRHVRTGSRRRRRLERRPDRRPVLADQIHRAGARRDLLAQQAEVLALAAAAEDQVHAPRRERAQRDERARDVGRLGVVDEEHAVQRRHLLEAVRDAGEARERLANAAARARRRPAPTAAAAIAFSRLCAPRRRIAPTSTRRSPRQRSHAPSQRRSAPASGPKVSRARTPGHAGGQGPRRDDGEVIAALLRRRAAAWPPHRTPCRRGGRDGRARG